MLSDSNPIFLETIFTEGLDPSINRESLITTDRKALRDALDGVRRKSLLAFFSKFSGSKFNAINFAVCGDGTSPSAKDAHWIQSFSGAEGGKLLPLDMPCADLPFTYTPQLRGREWLWQGRRIRILKPLRNFSIPEPLRAMRVLQDGGLALVRLPKGNVMPVWFWNGEDDVVPSGHNYCERFPPAWSKLMTVTVENTIFYNRDHEWVKTIARMGAQPRLTNVKAYVETLASGIRDKEGAIQFLFQLVSRGPNETYTIIHEHHSGDLHEVVRLAGLGDDMILYGWNAELGNASKENNTWVFTKSGFAKKQASKLSDGLRFADGMTFQFPDDSWWIKLNPRATAQNQLPPP
jgi:hypothetical protein